MPQTQFLRLTFSKIDSFAIYSEKLVVINLLEYETVQCHLYLDFEKKFEYKAKCTGQSNASKLNFWDFFVSNWYFCQDFSKFMQSKN